MMYALILDEKVVDTSEVAFEVAPQLTWVECDEDVTTRYTYKDGVFTAPQEPTDEELADAETLAAIHTLESQITARRTREAMLGDATAITFIQDIEDQIIALRAELTVSGE